MTLNQNTPTVKQAPFRQIEAHLGELVGDRLFAQGLGPRNVAFGDFQCAARFNSLPAGRK